jgi:hypothetical protein
VDSTDDKQPYTDQYNVTVSQRTPWSGLLEMSYVGNRTRDIPSGSVGGNSLNINLVPVGAMNANPSQDPNKLNADDFRPLKGFSNLYLATNNAWANYNSMQATWIRSQGRYNINLNYTFGKAMGIVGFYDQFNLANNYGVLPANRTHIFNAAYSIELGNPLKGNKFAQGVVNGWQFTGVTQVESGANLSGFNSQNFGMNGNGYVSPATGYTVTNTSILGTNNIQLNPIQTCNPTANLGPNQFVNGNCFALPTALGQNGPTIMPPIYGPAFFNTDLGLFKNFQIKEQMKVQFRFNAFNFLNHPLWSFPGGNNLALTFNGTTGAMNNPIFGYTTQKQGHRVIQFAVKFFF